MFLNFVVGFVIPWIFIINLYFKDKKLLLTVTFFQSTIAYTINEIAFYYGFWDVYLFGNKEIVHVPFDIGIYPMLSAWMIYYIKHKKSNPFIAIFILLYLQLVLRA